MFADSIDRYTLIMIVAFLSGVLLIAALTAFVYCMCRCVGHRRHGSKLVEMSNPAYDKYPYKFETLGDSFDNDNIPLSPSLSVTPAAAAAAAAAATVTASTACGKAQIYRDAPDEFEIHSTHDHGDDDNEQEHEGNAKKNNNAQKTPPPPRQNVEADVAAAVSPTCTLVSADTPQVVRGSDKATNNDDSPVSYDQCPTPTSAPTPAAKSSRSTSKLNIAVVQIADQVDTSTEVKFIANSTQNLFIKKTTAGVHNKDKRFSISGSRQNIELQQQQNKISKGSSRHLASRLSLAGSERASVNMAPLDFGLIDDEITYLADNKLIAIASKSNVNASQTLAGRFDDSDLQLNDDDDDNNNNNDPKGKNTIRSSSKHKSISDIYFDYIKGKRDEAKQQKASKPLLDFLTRNAGGDKRHSTHAIAVNTNPNGDVSNGNGNNLANNRVETISVETLGSEKSCY